jgi:hypothetical protein
VKPGRGSGFRLPCLQPTDVEGLEMRTAQEEALRVDLGASKEVAGSFKTEYLPYKLLKKFLKQLTPFCTQASGGVSRVHGLWPGRQILVVTSSGRLMLVAPSSRAGNVT